MRRPLSPFRRILICLVAGFLLVMLWRAVVRGVYWAAGHVCGAPAVELWPVFAGLGAIGIASALLSYSIYFDRRAMGFMMEARELLMRAEKLNLGRCAVDAELARTLAARPSPPVQ